MAHRSNWLALILAFVIMIGATLYPPLLIGPNGRADHVLALCVIWAMSAGFIRGVGFVPRYPALRWLFSLWAIGTALLVGLLWLYFR